MGLYQSSGQLITSLIKDILAGGLWRSHNVGQVVVDVGYHIRHYEIIDGSPTRENCADKEYKSDIIPLY